jgi:hypothetical protein
MDRNTQTTLKKKQEDSPLFASPWIALFAVLCKEFGYNRSLK